MKHLLNNDDIKTDNIKFYDITDQLWLLNHSESPSGDQLLVLE